MGFQFPTTWQELERIVNAGILDELSVEYKRTLSSQRFISTIARD